MDPETEKWLLVDRGLSYLTLATCACVIYDHICTMNDEIEVVWKRRQWSWVQYLFLINRYGGDAFQLANAFIFVRHIVNHTTKVTGEPYLPTNFVLISIQSHTNFSFRCDFIANFSGYLGMIVFVAMQLIMIFRLSSMYSHARNTVILLGSAFTLEIIAMIIIQVFSNGAHAPIVDPAPGLNLCQQNNFPTWSFVFWIPVILVELLLLGMAFHLAFKYYHTSQLIRRFRSTSPMPSLLFILLRDSIMFPFIGVAGSLANLIVWVTGTHLLTQISFTIVMFIPSIIGCRLILNLREAYYQPFEDECIKEHRVQQPSNTLRNTRNVEITRTVEF